MTKESDAPLAKADSAVKAGEKWKTPSYEKLQGIQAENHKLEARGHHTELDWYEIACWLQKYDHLWKPRWRKGTSQHHLARVGMQVTDLPQELYYFPTFSDSNIIRTQKSMAIPLGIQPPRGTEQESGRGVRRLIKDDPYIARTIQTAGGRQRANEMALVLHAARRTVQDTPAKKSERARQAPRSGGKFSKR